MIPEQPKDSTFNPEQWQAIHQKGGNILVSASAGSGKTTVLIERILTHIQTHYAKVDELLVVTFTELAAKEMKERMEQRLKHAISNASGEQRVYLLEQLRILPTSDIRTLHSFCLKVIQQFFYLKDIDPSFDLVTDETHWKMVQETVWENLIEAVMLDPSRRPKYLKLLQCYGDGRSDEPLFNIVHRIYTFARTHPDPMEWLDQATQLYLKPEAFITSELYQSLLKPYLLNIASSASQFLIKAQSLMLTGQDETIEKYEPLLNQEQKRLENIYELLLKDQLADAIAMIRNFDYERWPSTRKTHEDIAIVTEMKAYRDQAKNMVVSGIEAYFPYQYETQIDIEAEIYDLIQPLINLATAYMNQLTDYKNQHQLMDYNDLEHITLNILTDDDPETGEKIASPAAIYYQHHFKEVLVDEYQDINDIQAEILSWLSTEKVSNAPGNLFMVGDVKQSIYGFRMAEPSLFMNRYQQYQESEENHLILLNQNYRSRPEVLDYINYTFERIMDENVGEMEYNYNAFAIAGNQELIRLNEQQAIETEFLIQLTDLDEEENDDDAYESFTKIEGEIHLIAQHIQNRINQKEVIYDKKLGDYRPIEYRDIVLLASTKKNFLSVQQIFAHYDIPLLAQNTDNYFNRQEIQLMLALLKVIDNPIQDIPLVAVLRSFFVGLTDEELSIIRIHHRQGNFYHAILAFTREKFDTTSREGQISVKLNVFIEQLETYREYAALNPIEDLIWKIYLETYFLDYVAGLNNGHQRQANLHAFYQRAKDLTNQRFKGLSGFIYYIEQVMQAEEDLAEPILIDAEQNVVRAMTVHASKGLEFPIVYLFNAGKQFNLQDTKTPVLLSKDDGISSYLIQPDNHVRYQSLIRLSMRLRQEKKLKAEEMRKLYVALTRAEQQIIIVGSLSKENTFEKYIEQVELLTSKDSLLANDMLRQQSNNWLKWLIQAYAVTESSLSQSDYSKHRIRFSFVHPQDLQKRTDATDKSESTLLKIEDVIQQSNMSPSAVKALETVDQLMAFEYPFELASHTSSYQSVSELKRLYEEPHNDKLSYYTDRSETKEIEQPEAIQGIRYTEDTFQSPKFMKEESVSATDRGTFTHYVMQLLDFTAFHGETSISNELHRQMKEWQAKNFIDNRVVEFVNIESIEHFLASSLGQTMIKHSEALHREQAFSYLLPAEDLLSELLDVEGIKEINQDDLLVHGVIDVNIERDDHLILIDYKTNQYRPYIRLTKEQQIQELKEMYQFQMDLYAKALALAKQKPVRHAYLVLLEFEDIVEMI